MIILDDNSPSKPLTSGDLDKISTWMDELEASGRLHSYKGPWRPAGKTLADKTLGLSLGLSQRPRGGFDRTSGPL